MLIVHGTADRVVPYLQAELLAEAIAKTGAPFYSHTVVGGGHGVYFGPNFNASGTGFDAGGGGIGLFEEARSICPHPTTHRYGRTSVNR